jgi:hypothetical protein
VNGAPGWHEHILEELRHIIRNSSNMRKIRAKCKKLLNFKGLRETLPGSRGEL